MLVGEKQEDHDWHILISRSPVLKFEISGLFVRYHRLLPILLALASPGGSRNRKATAETISYRFASGSLFTRWISVRCKVF